MSEIHTPVLLQEIITMLVPRKPGLLVDVTLGLGGHSSGLLKACPECTLLGLDRDSQALELAEKRLRELPNPKHLVQAPFDQLPKILAADGFSQPIVILADLGCSSLQLDSAERGFSFSFDGPLDMRMGSEGPTAADFVNTKEPEELLQILWNYGEERKARAIVRAITQRRREIPFERSGELASLVARVSGPRGAAKIHPATRTFQALRIAVNDELGQLERFLAPAISALAPGGRLAVISFHSLEDRIVKHTFRRLEGKEHHGPGPMPEPGDINATIRVLTRKPIRPTEEETRSNPRARSARLRVAEKLTRADFADSETLFSSSPQDLPKRTPPPRRRSRRNCRSLVEAA